MKRVADVKLRVIGQGGGVYSTIAHGCSMTSYLLEIFNNRRLLKILLDTGYGTLGNALKMGIDPTQIDIISLSHFHIDHAADLAPFIHARERLAMKQGKTLGKLLVYGPVGTEDLFWGQEPLFGDRDFDPDIKFLEGQQKYGKIETVEVYHSDNIQSLATIFRGGYRKIVYTGDLRNDPRNFAALSGCARKADLLITEAAEVSNWHFDIEAAIRLYHACEAGYMVLGHGRPHYMPVVREACESSNGLFFQALDGATIKSDNLRFSFLCLFSAYARGPIPVRTRVKNAEDRLTLVFFMLKVSQKEVCHGQRNFIGNNGHRTYFGCALCLGIFNDAV